MTTDIAPSGADGLLFTQGGVGASPGYQAIDLRRVNALPISEGIEAGGAYLVSQRGLGANMSVDIAANVAAVVVQGDYPAQSRYVVAPHSTVINEAIGAADPTNPRVDQIILEVLDNVYDGSGLSKARTRVLPGTPTSGATLANRTGATALPLSAMRLADVLVPAASSSVVTANIADRRPKTRGKAIISATETLTAPTSYALATTPDRVRELVLPTDGLIAVAYQATWQQSVGGAARASIFIGTNQAAINCVSGASPQAGAQPGGFVNLDAPLSSYGGGLIGGAPTSLADVTTGQIIGVGESGANVSVEVAGGLGTPGGFTGGLCLIFAAAGAYDVSVQFKASSGNVTVKNRRLWAWVVDADRGLLT
jgi:hypothetical protein